MIIAAPRRRNRVRPQALQICRHVAGPRTRNHQVATKLKIKRDERRITSARRHRLQAFVRRQLRRIRRAEIKCHSVKQLLIVRHMQLTQSHIRLHRCCRQLIRRQFIGITVPPVWQLHSIIRRRRQQQRDLGGVLNPQRVVVRRNFSVPTDHRESRGEFHSGIGRAVPQLTAHEQLIPAHDRNLCRLRTRKTDMEIQRARLARLQMHDQHLIGKAGEKFTLKTHAIHLVTDRSQCRAEIKFAPII